MQVLLVEHVLFYLCHVCGTLVSHTDVADAVLRHGAIALGSLEYALSDKVCGSYQILVCEQSVFCSLKGLALPRASHTGEIALAGSHCLRSLLVAALFFSWCGHSSRNHL